MSLIVPTPTNYKFCKAFRIINASCFKTIWGSFHILAEGFVVSVFLASRLWKGCIGRVREAIERGFGKSVQQKWQLPQGQGSTCVHHSSTHPTAPACKCPEPQDFSWQTTSFNHIVASLSNHQVEVYFYISSVGGKSSVKNSTCCF